jgi:molecular chaperone DnaJ
MEKDLYSVLGVEEDADDKAIGRAYRRLARQLHPDTHPDDPAAVERFKDVTAAYDVIGDPEKRAEYDEFRRAMTDPRPTSGGSDTGWTTLDDDSLDDLLSSFFGRARRPDERNRRGADLEAVLDLGFEDAVRGLTTELTLSGPEGRRTFKVRVPAGVEPGQRIRLAGKGGPGANGGPPGDLYATVRVAGHPEFERSGRDLVVDVPVTWPDAVLGSDIEVPTLDGPTVKVRLPAGTPHGRVLRVRGRGVPAANGAGDLLVRVRLTVPDQLTGEQRKAVEAVARAFQPA